MDKRSICFILIALLFAKPLFVIAQEIFTDVNLPMMNFTPESGLSQVTVNAITQDKTGFMWFGTQTGLNRFDGYEFVQYRATPASKNHLAGNFITALQSCDENGLWIGTTSGLSLYDINTGLFRSFIKSFNPTIPSDNVQKIICSKEHIFVGTQANGAYRISLDDFKVTIFHGTQNLKVMDMRLSLNHVFIATDEGLFSVERKTYELKKHTNKALNTIAILENFIVAGRNDAWLEYYKINDSNLDLKWRHSLTENDKNTIKVVIKQSNMIYVGTNLGVSIFDTKGQLLQTYQHNDLISNSLADDIVLSLFIDNKLGLWIGTNSGGVSYFSNEIKKFGHVNHQNYQESPIDHVDIRAFSSDAKGQLWFATTKGAYVFNDEKFIKADILYEQLRPFENAFITNFFINGNDIWFTSRGDGIARFNINTNEFEQYSSEFNNSPAVSVNDLVLYGRDIIASTRGYGLLRYDEHKNMFVGYLNDKNNTSMDTTDLLVKDETLWFGSVGAGLFKYRNNRLEQLNTSNGLFSDIIFSLALDDKGRIWSTSEVGINITDDNLNIIESLNQKKGLINESVWSIVFDDINSMWVGTSDGLARIYVDTYEIDNYSALEGAQSAEFNFGAAWKSNEGRIFLGGTNGFNQFLPSEIVEVTHKPNLLLNTISILGEEITPQNSPELIQLQPHLVKEITLNYDQDIMSFNYVVLAFSNHRQMSYFYRIIGLSDKWMSLDDNSRQINLIKPLPGSYQLEVYALDQHGNKSNMHQLNIELLAPWWWSSVSKVVYIFLVTSAIILIFLYRYWVYKQVIKDNHAMAELKQRLELSLWASGDELWDWDLIKNKIRRYTVESRIDYGNGQNGESIDFIHIEDRDALHKKIEACLHQGVDSYELAVRVKDFFGNWCWVLDRGKVVARNSQGKVTRIAGSMRDITALKQHEDSLQDLNDKLEQKVSLRTVEISKKNEALKSALSQLEIAQEELVESEKMASLGSLVAGISHEINTPLGIAMTAITHNQDCLIEMEQKLDNKSLTQDDLINSNNNQKEGYRLILKNLDRANHLIASFKQVAVDQNSETQREVNLTEYIHEVMNSVKPLFNKKVIGVVIDGPEALTINTYPGPIYQVITNLVNNSVLHAFEHLEKGEIRIEISILEGRICLNYFDNGKGMDLYMLKHIFDPFVTSKRNQGGSGLGMNIVYNLVTQVLKGEIKCFSSPESGFEVKIYFPVSIN
ncbi:MULTISPECIES: ATP-binding protein [unclassified Pseudoalteromonas]|uniref:sensor histidine kinase n=1 Tax=unclassified Pseudoalteromonas TaxID=194690 RepID=UPI0006933E04|nr:MULTISPECIES: ATP-binding protein [unclassified Pseudoalteromonas]